MRINERALGIFRCEIRRTDARIDRVANPVDGVGEVEFLGRVVDVAVELLEHIHEVVVFRRLKQSVAVTSHKDAANAHMAANVDIDVANTLAPARCRRPIVGDHALDGGGVAAAVDITVDAHRVGGRSTLDADVHPVGERAPGIDVHDFHRVGGLLERRHGAAHRHGVHQRHLFRSGIGGVERIIFVDRHLGVAVAVVGIEIVAIARAIDIAEEMAAGDGDIGAVAAVVHEKAFCVQADVDIARDVVAAIDIAVDENI